MTEATVTDANALERRYRRLLTWYPAEHRGRYGAYMASVIPTHYPAPRLVDRIVIAVIALAGLSTLATSAGRRLIVLIAAIPLSGLAGTILTFAGINFYDMSLAAAVVTLYLPPVLLGGLIVAVIRRSSLRPALPATEATA
jgi:hypothetical protein